MTNWSRVGGPKKRWRRRKGRPVVGGRRACEERAVRRFAGVRGDGWSGACQSRPRRRSKHMHKTGTESEHMAGANAGAIRGAHCRPQALSVFRNCAVVELYPAVFPRYGSAIAVTEGASFRDESGGCMRRWFERVLTGGCLLKLWA